MYSDFVPFSSSVNIKNGELTASFSHPEFIHDLLFARNFQNILLTLFHAKIAFKDSHQCLISENYLLKEHSQEYSRERRKQENLP